MSNFSSKHPLVFGALLFAASIIASVPIMFVLQGMGQSVDVASAVARIVVGIVIAAVFHASIRWEKSFSGVTLALPALGFAAWNLVYNKLGGCLFVSPSALPAALVMGFAPGFLEELIFRGVTIDALKRSGATNMRTLMLSALLFAAAHLTNIVGLDPLSVVIQVSYSLVVGLVFGAIYLASGDIASVILGHASIDIASQVFASHPASTPIPQVIAFVVLLAAEAAYALWVMKKKCQ